MEWKIFETKSENFNNEQNYISKGSFGSVYSGIDGRNRPIAIKQFFSEENRLSSSIIKEISITEYLRVKTKADNSKKNQRKKENYLVLPLYINKNNLNISITYPLYFCDLHDILYNRLFIRSPISNYVIFNRENSTDKEKLEQCLLEKRRTISMITKSILKGLVILENLKIEHRDIKPNNILVRFEGINSNIKSIEENETQSFENILINKMKNREFSVSIADFGNSGSYHNSISHGEKNMSGISAVYYKSPELLENMNTCNKIDVWALGCLIAEMALCKPFLSGKDVQEQKKYIDEIFGNNDYQEKKEEINQKFSKIYFILGKEGMEVLDKCLVYQENERSNASEILRCKFFN